MGSDVRYATDGAQISFRWPYGGPFKVYLRDNKTLCDTLLRRDVDYTILSGAEYDLARFVGMPPAKGQTVIIVGAPDAPTPPPSQDKIG